MSEIQKTCLYDSKGRSCKYSSHLERELANFQKIASRITPLPGEIPILSDIEIHGTVLPLNGAVGGDHILYADFKRRYNLDLRIDQSEEPVRTNLQKLKEKAGVLISDVAGHDITDASLSGRLHDAFFLGALYELELHGEITAGLFEKLNTRFYNSSTVLSNFGKYITMIYGEISEEGEFRFISAAHPNPIVFSSKHNQIIDLGENYINGSTPLGMFPSEASSEELQSGRPIQFKADYEINQIKLENPGDIILLHSDGLSDHNKKGRFYVPEKLEEILQNTKGLSAEEIVSSLTQDILEFADPSDDISYIIIKKI
jgi:serine phosphatase RsbU (regulator of sigma subunit)